MEAQPAAGVSEAFTVRVEAGVKERLARLAESTGHSRRGHEELVVAGSTFVVPYRVKADRIQILRVYHGAPQMARDALTDFRAFSLALSRK